MAGTKGFPTAGALLEVQSPWIWFPDPRKGSRRSRGSRAGESGAPTSLAGGLSGLTAAQSPRTSQVCAPSPPTLRLPELATTSAPHHLSFLYCEETGKEGRKTTPKGANRRETALPGGARRACERATGAGVGPGRAGAGAAGGGGGRPRSGRSAA